MTSAELIPPAPSGTTKSFLNIAASPSSTRESSMGASIQWPEEKDGGRNPISGFAAVCNDKTTLSNRMRRTRKMPRDALFSRTRSFGIGLDYSYHYPLSFYLFSRHRWRFEHRTILTSIESVKFRADVLHHIFKAGRLTIVDGRHTLSKKWVAGAATRRRRAFRLVPRSRYDAVSQARVDSACETAAGLPRPAK